MYSLFSSLIFRLVVSSHPTCHIDLGQRLALTVPKITKCSFGWLPSMSRLFPGVRHDDTVKEFELALPLSSRISCANYANEHQSSQHQPKSLFPPRWFQRKTSNTINIPCFVEKLQLHLIKVKCREKFPCVNRHLKEFFQNRYITEISVAARRFQWHQWLYCFVILLLRELWDSRERFSLIKNNQSKLI